MPSYPSKPKTLAGDGGLATEGETLRLRSGRDPSASLRAGSFGFAQSGLPALQCFFALRWFFAGGEGAR
jgi:hypothetical protein